MDDISNPPTTEEAFMQLLDVMEQVRLVANAERLKLEETGWSSAAAEKMGMAVYTTVLAQVMGQGPR